MLSFVFAGLCIWRWLVPALLKGYDPIVVTLVATTVMTGAIILLVGGTGKKGLTALGGSVAGIAFSGSLAFWFTGEMQIHVGINRAAGGCSAHRSGRWISDVWTRPPLQPDKILMKPLPISHLQR